MTARVVVRPAVLDDVPGLARVHVDSWRETFRGQMADAILDDPGFVAQRERFWTAALTDERYRDSVAATATVDDTVVGVAMSGPPLDADASATRQLYVLYSYAAVHGRGVGPALLDAVLDPREVATLWVADPSPRAQAFYLKHRFVFDGSERVEHGLRVRRMVRHALAAS